MIALYNHNSEKYLIGALLQDPELQKQLPAIPTDMMHDPAHAMILGALKQMQARKDPIELLNVSNRLTDEGKSDQMGGMPYLLECVRFCPSTANASHYLGELRTLMESRNAYRMAAEFCRKLSDGEELNGAIDGLRTQLRNLVTPKRKVVRASELAVLLFDDLERRSKGENTALRTWVPDLDALIWGLEKTDFMVIGARPAVGKSAFGLDIGTNVAQHGKSVMICSREMTRIQYAHRIASHLSGVNGQRMKRGQLTTEDWDDLTKACNELSGMPINFEFDCPTVEELRVMAQQEKDLFGLDLIVVDYLQIMKTTARKKNRYEEVGEVSRGLKEIALDLEVPVIAMAQVGRQTNGQKGGERAQRMPCNSDLRESGNIEQDADIIVFLHHPAGENDPDIPRIDAEKGMFDVIENKLGHEYQVIGVTKQRMGQCGSFGIDFDPAHMTYMCIDRS